MRERWEQCRGEYSAVGLHVLGERENVAGWPVFGCVAHDRRQQRLPAPGHDGLHGAVECSDQDPPCLHAGLVHVDVRVGLVAGNDCCVVDQGAGQVRVIVERHRNGHVRCDAANALDDFPFSIVAVVDYHRAMQIEHDGVAARAYRLFEGTQQRFKGCA